jgi:hypothetical protein
LKQSVAGLRILEVKTKLGEDVREYQNCIWLSDRLFKNAGPTVEASQDSDWRGLARTMEPGHDCRFTTISVGLSHHVTKSALHSERAELLSHPERRTITESFKLMRVVCFEGVVYEHAG